MKIIARWRLLFFKTLQLQFFLTLISLPFLIGWGLPVSLLAPISTIIFGPFLTVLLLIASFIFFCELCSIPDGLFIWCFEGITSFWLFFLGFEQRAWLIAFKKPSFILLIAIFLLAFAVLHSRHIKTIVVRTSIFALLLMGLCVCLKLFCVNKKTIDTIVCNKGEITLINHDNMLVVIDPGFIAASPSFEVWISYTFINALIEKTGRMNIDHFIVFNLNKRVFDALAVLAQKMTINTLYLPAWNGKIPLFAWNSYVKLKKVLSSYGGKIVPISYKKTIFKTMDSNLTIEPNNEKDVCCYYEVTYPRLIVKGKVETEDIALLR